LGKRVIMFQRFREKIERDFYLKYKYTFSSSIKIRLGNVLWIERSSQLSSLGDDDATHFKKRRRISSYSNCPLNDDSILRRQITVKTSNVFTNQLFYFACTNSFKRAEIRWVQTLGVNVLVKSNQHISRHFQLDLEITPQASLFSSRVN